ncbi:UNVERIFIED_CONTAM: hypothetical protein FKN15_073656 [Acipenser sinensis]
MIDGRILQGDCPLPAEPSANPREATAAADPQEATALTDPRVSTAGGEPLAMKAVVGAKLLPLVKVEAEATPASHLQVVVVEETDAIPLLAAGHPPFLEVKAAGAPLLLTAFQLTSACGCGSTSSSRDGEW